jgi:ATP-dependent RNA helicase DHX37/DHR1
VAELKLAPMPPSRPERFNAKARKSIAGGSSHKKKKFKKSKDTLEDDVDPNAEILPHKTSEEKEATRREILKQEVRTFSVTVRPSSDCSLALTLIESDFEQEEKKAGKVHCASSHEAIVHFSDFY